MKLYNIAVIPARGGSKRIPRKNIKYFCGKPIIAYSIQVAKECGCFDKVIVSTDDQEIADISKQYGADVPFIRPDNISSDHSTSVEVVRHALNTLEEFGYHYDYVILLQPTSPLRTAEHIDAAVKLFVAKDADAVISVTKTTSSPLWANTIPKNGSMDNFLQENVENKRSQDLPIYYELNGAIYLINSQKILEENTFFLRKNVFSYQMGKLSSIDIDTNYDFFIASMIARDGFIDDDI